MTRPSHLFVRGRAPGRKFSEDAMLNAGVVRKLTDRGWTIFEA
jgi:hypothetical protein